MFQLLCVSSFFQKQVVVPALDTLTVSNEWSYIKLDDTGLQTFTTTHEELASKLVEIGLPEKKAALVHSKMNMSRFCSDSYHEFTPHDVSVNELVLSRTIEYSALYYSVFNNGNDYNVRWSKIVKSYACRVKNLKKFI